MESNQYVICGFRSIPRHCPSQGQKSKEDWGAHPAFIRGGAARSGPAEQGDATAIRHVGSRLYAHATAFRLWTDKDPLATQPLRHPSLLPTDASPGVRLAGLLPQTHHRDAFLHLLLHGGNQGSVFSGQGAEEAILEVSYQVLDVVSKTRRTDLYQRGLRAGKNRF